MAINKNHEFEEINGIKCGIVEKNVSAERAAFLREILEANRYLVEMATSSKPAADGTPGPETFTIGVTDVTFNPINAVFGRLLKTKDGRVVTLAYWQQKETISNDEVPYFEK